MNFNTPFKLFFLTLFNKKIYLWIHFTKNINRNTPAYIVAEDDKHLLIKTKKNNYEKVSFNYNHANFSITRLCPSSDKRYRKYSEFIINA